MDDALPADARRASHADRDAVAERLREAAADGRLTLDELGGVDLDLREAELESREVVIRVFALLGGVDIVVPDDMVLDASGFGFMGGFEQRDPAGDPPPDAPVVKVRGLALMGGIDAVRRPRRGNTAVEAPHRRELGR